MSQETNTFKLPPIETLQPTPPTRIIESLFILLLRSSYYINAHDIERVKMYGRAMFEEGCCVGAEAALNMVRVRLVESSPSSPSIN